MEKAGLIPLAGIVLMLVHHQTAERGEDEVLILGRHHGSFPVRHSGSRLGDRSLGADPSLRSGYWIGGALGILDRGELGILDRR
jgi:hypothetical protein